ncbi:protein jade-1 [Limosa lapponica baueri]|uniref:Protein jade-1 n=1 Tax=Limosa lapponica baueri TaxID=1758121 RepID=A0A2I0U048_LIMLA|nr:protein jade-1 [Limosa lapponica baueri]
MVFRTDLITAMKLHDSFQLNPDEYYVLADPWRQEWEKGVQVPVSPGTIPEPVARIVSETKAVTFTRPRKYIVSSGSEPPELGYVDIRTLADSVCRYDLNDVDVAWLQLANEEFKEMGMPELDEYTMERVIEEFEQRCYDNMNHAIETEEGLGIEYDEDVVCDVCQSPDGEDGNEMVFCDKCNICVHQLETDLEIVSSSSPDGTGVPSSFPSMETTVLFNSPSLGPNAPKIEDLKWHSAFFRKQMGTSLTHSLKKPHKRDRVRNSSGNDGKSMLRQPSQREGGAAPGSFLNFDKPFAETRIVSAQQKNGVVIPDHRKRRDNRPQCEVIKAELKEKTSKHNHKPLRPTELSQRQSENKRATNHSSGRSAPGTRRDIVPKCNGGLVKVNSNQTVVKVPTTPTSPVKNWGGFRIPKKGERQQQGESPEETCRQNSSYPYLGVGRTDQEIFDYDWCILSSCRLVELL